MTEMMTPAQKEAAKKAAKAEFDSAREAVGTLIFDARKAAQMSVDDFVAALSERGVKGDFGMRLKKADVQAIEAGSALPKAEDLDSFAQALQLDEAKSTTLQEAFRAAKKAKKTVDDLGAGSGRAGAV